MFTSITSASGMLPIGNTILITVCSILYGLLIAFTYMSKGKYTKNYAITLVILPTIVQVVIMMVNGSVGAGIATAGAFSLIRFRSQPATSKEISTIFLAMAVGLINAMGYLTLSLFLTIVFCLLLFILEHTRFGEPKRGVRQIKITIPENLDYTTVFDDIFDLYLKDATLEHVKTTNMGSMFELAYTAEFKNQEKEKEFIDAVRCRNGNLTILVSRPMPAREDL